MTECSEYSIRNPERSLDSFITVEFNLFHDGKSWIAISSDGEIIVSGKSLEELDKKVKNILKERYNFESGTNTRINMKFDYRTAPFWMTQYGKNHLHRTIYVKI